MVTGSVIATGTQSFPAGAFVWSKGTFTTYSIHNLHTGLFAISNTGILGGQVFMQDFWFSVLKAGSNDLFSQPLQRKFKEISHRCFSSDDSSAANNHT
jgi:hypothetical protein